MFVFDDTLRTRESFRPLFLGRLIGVDFLFLQELTRHEVRIAT